MTDLPSHSAYCPNCVKNVPHFRRVRNPVLRLIDSVIGGLLEQIRVGPWYCLHCERRTLIRRNNRFDAVDYRIVDPEAPLEYPEDSVWVKANSSSDSRDADSETPTCVDREPDRPIGNYIKNNKSLVLRKSRLLRFSEKYRDAVVERLLGAEATISEVRREKDLSERELLDWIADRVERLESEIEHLREDSGMPPVLQVVSRQEFVLGQDATADRENGNSNDHPRGRAK